MGDIAKQLRLPKDVEIGYNALQRRYVLTVSRGGVTNLDHIDSKVIAEKRTNAELYAFIMDKVERMRAEIGEPESTWREGSGRTVADAMDAYEKLVDKEKFSEVCRIIERYTRELIDDNPA